MQYEHIEVEPLAGSLGATVTGCRLADLSEAQVAEIQQAFLAYHVLTFPDQPLEPDEQKAFARHFGPFGVEPYVKTMPEHPEIIELIKEPDEKRSVNFGGTWHSDWSFLETPPLATVLHAKEVPPFGGDTIFANMELSYETLSPVLRSFLDGLIVVHSARRSYAPGTMLQKRGPKHMSIIHDDTAYEETEHPLVREHPQTGRRSIFANPVYAIRIKGMRDAESDDLLGMLNRHGLQEGYTCRVRWRPDTLTMWDNRCVQHLALNDYDGYRRRMHRITVAGDRPFGPAMPRTDRAA